MPTLDTLRLKTRLSDNGMSDGQARALVEELDDALTTAITNQVATKADIEASRVEIKALRGDGMAEIKLLKWVGGVLLTFQVVVMGKLFFG